MPRFDKYSKLLKNLNGSVDLGIRRVSWSADGESVGYTLGGKNTILDIATGATKEGTITATDVRGRRRRVGPQRGRQFDTTYTADGKVKAVSRDRNVYISDADGSNEVAVTTEGSVANRIKYGTGSWVYGEELAQTEAMWFSPDGKKLAYYRFDESDVKDYYVAYSQLQIQDVLNTEPYPKAGAPNPHVELYIYDLASKQSTKVATDFGDKSMSEYIFNIAWSKDGSELYFYRMNRKQMKWQFCAANPSNGTGRVILEENRNDGWVDQQPQISWLEDGKRFIINSDRSGFHNLYLYDIEGTLLKTLTSLSCEVEEVQLIDEKNSKIFYSARSAPNPYLSQLHSVNIDGTGEASLTDINLSHTSTVSPNGKYFVDIAEDVSTAPVTNLCDASGKVLKQLSKSDTSKFDALKFKRAQRFTFTAGDGKTKCYGSMSFPSDFNPHSKYPVIVFVYGGPESGGTVEHFKLPNPITELGFIVAEMDGRNTSGRGRAFLCAGYRKLGTVEIDDHAAGVQALAHDYKFIDGSRVGIQGTSYGGYFSAMSILRYPNVYAASCSSSPVTDWRNYDSIYTERYMGLPTAEDNSAGYEAGSCMTYADKLQGRLMLYFGTSDNNVHPANTLQLATKLESLGKKFDLQIGADKEHTQMNASRMWEYFINNLIIDPQKFPQKQAARWRKLADQKLVKLNISKRLSPNKI